MCNILYRFTLIVVLTLASGVFAIEVGETLQDFTLKDRQPDGTFTLQSVLSRDLKKSPFLILQFSSVSCEPCHQEIHEMYCSLGMFEKAAMRMVVSTASHSESEIDKLVDQYKVELLFPLSYDRRFLAAKSYKVSTFPTLVVLNQENKIVYKHIGLTNGQVWQEINAIVK